MKRSLTAIEAAKTASGQKPYLLEIKFNGQAPTLIIGNIFHNKRLRTAKWDPITGEATFGNVPAPEHNLQFNSN